MSSTAVWNQRGSGGFQLRVEALTSGVLSPDPKAITLWSMQSDVRYTKAELYKQVMRFADLDELPLTSTATWGYCNGAGNWEGSLSSIGATVKVEVTTVMTATGPKAAYAYEKTGAGSAFGDPAAALGIAFVNELLEHGKPTPLSLLRIFSSSNKTEDASARRGFSVYMITRLLANSPDTEFDNGAIVKKLEKLGLTRDAVSFALSSLGASGMIAYMSPYKEYGGKRARGWAIYKAESTLDYETCLKDIKMRYPKFNRPGGLRAVVDCFNENPKKALDHNELVDKIGIRKEHASGILSYLRNTGHLNSQFEGCKRSIAKANELTFLLWNDLLEPIGRAAETMNPRTEGFRDKLSMYTSDPQLLVEHIGNVFEIYGAERNNVGPASGPKVRSALLAILRSENGNPIKNSELTERLNEIRADAGLSPLTSSAVNRHLNLLRKGHAIEQPKPGWYAINQQP